MIEIISMRPDHWLVRKSVLLKSSTSKAIVLGLNGVSSTYNTGYIKEQDGLDGPFILSLLLLHPYSIFFTKPTVQVGDSGKMPRCKHLLVLKNFQLPFNINVIYNCLIWFSLLAKLHFYSLYIFPMENTNFIV